jgi:uncharacterized protein (TIGR03435 family)
MTLCASNAPGLKQVRYSAGGGRKPGGFRLNGNEMNTIAAYLENTLGKPVVDETGLTGLWAADLHWEMSDSELTQDSDPNPDHVIKAVREQLGIQLQPVRRELEVMEVDAAE